jgi:hypothetical protein
MRRPYVRTGDPSGVSRLNRDLPLAGGRGGAPRSERAATPVIVALGRAAEWGCHGQDPLAQYAFSKHTPLA